MPKTYHPSLFLAYCIGNTVYCLLMIYSYLAGMVMVGTRPEVVVLSSVGTVCRIASLVLQWTIWRLKKSDEGEYSKYNEIPFDTLAKVEIAFPISVSIAVALRLIVHLIQGNCVHGTYQSSYLLCNKYYAEGGVSLPLFIELMFTPILTFSLLRDIRQAAILVSWMIGCGVLISYAAILASADIGIATVMYLLVSLLLYLDNQLRLEKTLNLVHQLQDTQQENARLMEEAQGAELRAMIGNIAHDLKSPLTSFLSGLECILEVVTPWEALLSAGNTEQFVSRAHSNLAAILSSIHSMSATNSFMTMTINRCLDYTKATQGFRLVPKHETIALRAVMEMPIKMMRDVQQTIELRLWPWNELICSHVITDKQWLLENLLCLLSNAVKYSQHGRVDIGVHLRDRNNQEITDPARLSALGLGSSPRPPAEPEAYLHIEVQDTGIGLSDEAMQVLFNPFKQAQRMAGGTGLGLFSLAKRVEALHGKYGVCRRPDGAQGSVFWFTVPYRPDHLCAEMNKDNVYRAPSPDGESAFPVLLNLPDIPEPTQQPLDPTVPDGADSYGVLVVDDAPLIIRMTRMLLTRKGHRVSSAANGAEALEQVLAGYELLAQQGSTGTPPFDVVIMDLQMPVMDGIEALKRLRRAERQMQMQGTQGQHPKDQVALPPLPPQQQQKEKEKENGKQDPPATLRCTRVFHALQSLPLTPATPTSLPFIATKQAATLPRAKLPQYSEARGSSSVASAPSPTARLLAPPECPPEYPEYDVDLEVGRSGDDLAGGGPFMVGREAEVGTSGSVPVTAEADGSGGVRRHLSGRYHQFVIAGPPTLMLTPYMRPLGPGQTPSWPNPSPTTPSRRSPCGISNSTCTVRSSLIAFMSTNSVTSE